MGCWQRRKGGNIENKQEGGPRNWGESRATGSEALAYLSATDGVSVAQKQAAEFFITAGLESGFCC